METIDSEWIKSRLTGKRGEMADLANAIGISTQKMSKIMTGERRVQAVEVPKIISYFQDTDAKTDTTAKAPERPLLVPIYDVNASAGYGAIVEYEPITSSLAFPPHYLKRLTTTPADRLAIISVKGDSMSPTILDNDVVLVDMTKTHLGYEGLFVLRHNDTLLVKRASMAAKSGMVTLTSDNPQYPPTTASLDEISVVGKILWYGRKVF